MTNHAHSKPITILASADHNLRMLVGEVLHEHGYLVLASNEVECDAVLSEFSQFTLNDIALIVLHLPEPLNLANDLALWRQVFPQENAILLLLADADAITEKTYAQIDDLVELPTTRAVLVLRIRTLSRLVNRLRALKAALSPDENERITHDLAERLFDDRYRVISALTQNFVFSFIRNENDHFEREWGDETGAYYITGYTYRDLEERGGWEGIVYPDDLAIVREMDAKSQKGETTSAEYRIVNAAGNIVWVKMLSEPFIDKRSGQVKRVHAVVQDITEQKRIEQEKREQRQRIQALQNTILTLSSTLDKEMMLDRILLNIAQIIPYDVADVMLVENGIARIARHRGYVERGIESVVPDIVYDITEVAGLKQMTETRQVLLIPDVSKYPGWRHTIQNRFSVLSYLGAPVFIHDRIVGYLNLYSATPGAFNTLQAEHIEVLASQVAVAINNAQLYNTVSRHSNELEMRIRDLIMVYEVGKLLSSTLNVSEIYALIYHEVAQRIFDAQNMRVLLYDEDELTVRTVYAIEAGEEIDAAELPIMTLGEDPASMAIRTHNSYFEDNRIYEPLISRDRCIGVLEIHQDKHDTFDEVVITLLSTIAGQAAVALDNAQLYEKLSRYAAELEDRVQERTAKLRAALLVEQEAGAMRSRFLANVQHEFRTPLTLILSASELLERYSERMPPEQRQERYNQIRESVTEMGYLLDSAQLVNQADDGLLHSNPQPVDIGLFTEAVVLDFKRQANKTHLLTYNAYGDHSIGELDSDLWRRIIKELIWNAVRYSSPGSTIHCTLDCFDDRFTFTVIDQGIGIPADDLPHVFEMFYRGINVQNLPGSGLGLPIVKRLVDLHHGKIDIQSKVGQGTTVEVTLPRYAARGEGHDQDSRH